jgi:REP element-mobilizing transposase RayT
MPPRQNFPLAYHITWGTYGTRLHGDDRGTVHRAENQFGDPILGQDADWQRMESHRLRFPARTLNLDQRLHIETTFTLICARGGWKPVEIAAAADHVHCIASADVDGDAIRKWLKRWMSQAMSERWRLESDQVWWAECGSVKWIWESAYLQRAIAYVNKQKTSR